MKRVRRGIVLSSFLLIFSVSFTISAVARTGKTRVTVITHPVPTCEENLYRELKYEAELVESISDENFLIKPTSVVADAEGNVYVFDKKQNKILKYDKDLKYLASCGRSGFGPGEFGVRSSFGANVYLSIGRDNLLYAGDRDNSTIHCFDLNLRFKKDLRLQSGRLPFIFPVFDEEGNSFAFARPRGEGIIDVFNSRGEHIKTLLDKEAFQVFLFFNPTSKMPIFNSPVPGIVFYDIIGDKLIVYMSNSGYLYVFKKLQLQNEIKLWPKKALKIYRERLKASIEEGSYVPYFHRLIIDRDDEKSFYLQFGRDTEGKRVLIYKFNLTGKLEKVLYIIQHPTTKYPWIYYKKNNLFYAVGQNKHKEKTIISYKEVIE